MYEAVKNDPKIVVLAISEDGRGREHVQRWMTKRGFSVPVALDLDGRVQADYEITGIPTTFVIRPDGTIAKRHMGELEFHTEAFLAEMRQLAAGKASAPAGGL